MFSVNFQGDGQASGATLAYSDNAGDSWVITPIGGHGFDGQSIGTGPPVSGTLPFPTMGDIKTNAGSLAGPWPSS